MGGLPSQLLAGQGAGGRDVHRREQREQAEMVLRLFRRESGYGQVQVPADDLGDVKERHALVIDPVQPRARGCCLQGQPEQVRGVQPVHGGPAVGPLAHIGRQALRASDADEGRDEGVIALAVHRRRQAHHRDAYAAPGQRQRHRFGDARIRRVVGRVVLFGRETTRRVHETGGDDEGPIGSRQGLADRLDGAPVDPGVGRGVVVFRKVVNIRGVDHAVGGGRAAAQTGGVLQGAAVHRGPGGRQRHGGPVRTGQAGDLMSGVEQLTDDG